MNGRNTTFDPDGIPAAIPISPDQQIPVTVEPLDGKLGEFDCEEFGIRIHYWQSGVQKHIILIHEMLHAAEEILVQMKEIKRRSPEKYIQEMAPLVLVMLVRSGLYTGVTVEAVERYQESA